MDADVTRMDLTAYPRPSVAVDVALLTVVLEPEPQLAVVVVRPDGDPDGRGWRLPGTFLHEGERLSQAVERLLRSKVGLPHRDRAPEQLRVFDDPSRDERGWVLSAAHRDTVRAEEVPARGDRHDVAVAAVLAADGDDGGIGGVVLPGGQPSLPYDHADVLGAAVADLRERYAADPDPGGYLDEIITLRDLRRVHEAVAGQRLLPDTFRRHVAHGLEETREWSRGGVGRPAQLFRRLTPDERRERRNRRPARSNAARDA